MVRVRRRNTNNSSTPVRNPGTRRRYPLRERTRRNRPANDSLILEHNNDVPLEYLTISSIITSSSVSNPTVTNNSGGNYTVEFQESGNPTELEDLLATEGELLQLWGEQAPHTADKQTQCREEDFSLLPPPIIPNYSPCVDFPEPSYSPVYEREYSPVLTSFPRWYLLPEEYESELINREDSN